jgi:hypothetical protein
MPNGLPGFGKLLRELSCKLLCVIQRRAALTPFVRHSVVIFEVEIIARRHHLAFGRYTTRRLSGK